MNSLHLFYECFLITWRVLPNPEGLRACCGRRMSPLKLIDYTHTLGCDWSIFTY